jgi:CheY-like chemotaxis protein
MNLVLNGRDAMPSGGALTIRAQRVAAAGVEIPGSPLAEYVEISISDTGSGMTGQTQARVFEPFFTTKPRGQGTGLGLATVQGIVAQSGGDVTVHSRLGQGTTFTVHLPLVKSPLKNVEIGHVLPAADSKHRGGTVLLVEDEAAVRRAEAMVLESAGYRVLQAGDGVEGLEVAARYRGEISIVVTDVLMPKLSGPDFVHCLATLRPRTRVLFTSGYTGNATEDGRIATDSTVLAKPFTAGGLLAAVSGVLRAPPPSSHRNGAASANGQAAQPHHEQDGDERPEAEHRG